MISKKMNTYVQNSSIIRAMFEEGKRLAGIHGAENVYDFSLGNPSIGTPKEVNEAMIEILKSEQDKNIHGYMNNSGFEDVREEIADSINKKYQTNLNYENIVMTVGAAGGLNVIFKTLLDAGDEVMVFAPYFGEYRSYVANYDGVLVEVPPNTVDFQPDLSEFEKRITSKTKAVIVNSPNNPTGVVYSEDTIKGLADILFAKQKEFNSNIYLISDEPYREIAYDGVFVPYLTRYYLNTIVGYSYSKSLSLPGERIGYLVIPNEAADSKEIIAGANIANRILGFVNAPSLMQRVVAKCVDVPTDIKEYKKNRDLLYDSLTEYGYACLKPEGAFYMFLKSLDEDDAAFAAKAKEYNILIVPGRSFSCEGYCRIAYCVDHQTIIRALPAFKKLYEEYQK